MQINRRAFGGAMVSIFAMALAGSRAANGGEADYPVRPVNLILPVGAGGGPDVIARMVADRLAQLWHQQLILLNRPGAGGLIALQAAAGVAPNGYTLYMPLSSTYCVLPQTHPHLPLMLDRDLVPIGVLGEQPMVIAVDPKLGIGSLAELIALAKRRPGEILYGANPGGLPNLTGELLQQRAGFKLRMVPYSNTVKALQDTAGGTGQVAIESLSGLGSLIQSGMLRPLAVASAKRLPNYPNLPTVAEAVPSVGPFEARGWFALTALTGTPDAIVRKINADLRTALADAELHKKFASLGTYPMPMSLAETAAFIHGEQDLWRPVVRKVLLAQP
ncbi:MAG TPA: tripartite tricarboxylate transporter substrate binding protein [Xanthobacteraceae bacterium]|jgi:tripartite-type tricarboxylate transporter receptor subunit TctC